MTTNETPTAIDPRIKYAFWGATFLIFAAVNGLIAQKEQTIRTGRTVLLSTAPRDPRSLMQGDYMAITCQAAEDIARAVHGHNGEPVHEVGPRGQIVVQLDEHDAGRFVRIHAGEPLAANEALIPYHWNGHRAQIGVDSFFFQEGEAGEYSRAVFAEYKVSGSDAVLVGLRDASYRRLGKQ